MWIISLFATLFAKSVSKELNTNYHQLKIHDHPYFLFPFSLSSSVFCLPFFVDVVLHTSFFFSQTSKMRFAFKLTHSHLKLLADASAADDFSKHCDKRRNCSKQAISPFATTFFQFSKQLHTLIYRDFLCFCPYVSKVLCCRFVTRMCEKVDPFFDFYNIMEKLLKIKYNDTN